MTVGVVLGVLAASNLVQGAWVSDVPWLNLTTASFILAIPASILALTHPIPLRAIVALLLLFSSLSFGYLAPALSPSADDKRITLVITVALVVSASILCLTNSGRVKAFLVTLVVFAMIVVTAQLVNPDLEALTTGRRTPMGLNAIGAGRAIGSGLTILVALALSIQRLRAVLILLAMPLGLGLLLAGSRGPILGVAAACFIIVCLQSGLHSRTKVILLALLVVLGSLAYYKLLLSGSRLAVSTTSGRTELYLQALKVVMSHPMGIGWGNFYRYLRPSALESVQGDRLYVHNIILEFGIEAGLLGVTLFVAFLAVAFRQGMRGARSPTDIAVAALATSLFVGALLSSDVVGNRALWVVLGAMLARTARASLITPRDQDATP